MISCKNGLETGNGGKRSRHVPYVLSKKDIAATVSYLKKTLPNPPTAAEELFYPSTDEVAELRGCLQGDASEVEAAISSFLTRMCWYLLLLEAPKLNVTRDESEVTRMTQARFSVPRRS